MQRYLALGLFAAALLASAGCGDSTGGSTPDLVAAPAKDLTAGAVDLAAAAADLAVGTSADLVAETPDLAAETPDLAVETPDLAPPSPDLAPAPDLTPEAPDLAVTGDLATGPRCDDGMKNQDETDVDCGGAKCGRCADGKGCAKNDDCDSAFCKAGVCTAPTCMDGAKNGKETDVDCGEGCPKCGNGRGCGAPSDCASGVCAMNVCAAPNCMDAVKNQDETDVDCGGKACGKCGDGKGCQMAGDCQGGVCAMNACQSASCKDKVKNGAESDVDCGGGVCPACDTGKGCAKAADCASGVCSVGKCAAPTCSDKVKNGGETDVDCGGSCQARCPVGKACGKSGDCDLAVCDAGTCRHAESCKELKAHQPALPSGVYTLDADQGGAYPDFPVYCEMVADGGGWTLVMKIDGAKSTFGFYSPLWTNAAIHNAGFTALDNVEAKFLSYFTMPFSELRLGMNDGAARWIVVAAKGISLLDTVKSGFVKTTAGRAKWLSLVGSPALQPNCNAEGFNAPGNEAHSRVRIGITGNNENDCSSCDSFVGFGGLGQGCGTSDAGNTCGNWMTCEASVNKKVFGYVFLR